MYGDYSYMPIDPATVKPIEEVETIGSAVYGAAIATTLITIFVSLIVMVIMIIAYWKLFTKAGQKGWKSLIPIYNNVILFRIAGLSPWLILGYFASIIPVIGGLAVLGLTIYLMYKLAVAFGKDRAFTVGLVLLSPIFMMILAFGKSEYQLNK